MSRDAGRTTWWPCDAAEHDRELNVELGEEFGPAGPYVMRVLKDLAQQQKDGGRVRTGFRVLRTKTFLDAEQAKTIVAHAAAIGALDDLQIDEDGRRFTCRVSGWEADQKRGREAIKKAAQRAAHDDDSSPPEGTNGELVPSEGDVSRSVPLPDQTRQDKEETDHVEPVRLDDARRRIQGEAVKRVFDAWVEVTSRTGRTLLDDKRRKLIRLALERYPEDDVIAAVKGWRHSPHHRGENSSRTVYNDLTLLLRDTEHIEKFRDLELNGAQPHPASSRLEHGRDFSRFDKKAQTS